MRRLAAALIATTLLLAGCSGGSGDADADAEKTNDSTATPDDAATLEAVEVEGDLGAAPTLTFEQPFTISEPVARVDVEGEGEPLEDGQTLSIHYVAVSGDDGTSFGSTWDLGTPESLILGDEAILPALTEALTGQKVGARVLFAAPGGAATETSEAYPATIMAIEVLAAKTLPTRAEGEAVAPAEGLPTVTLAENGEPSISIPADYPTPADLVVQPLIEGTGPVVETGQSVTVQYSGWTLDGEQFDSSWARTPFTTTIGTGAVITGWDEAIVGRTVGSQLLLVVPKEKAYAGTENALAEETLVFVVDILDAS